MLAESASSKIEKFLNLHASRKVRRAFEPLTDIE